MKQLSRTGWLKAIIVVCLANTTASCFARASVQFSRSLDYYAAGRYRTENLN